MLFHVIQAAQSAGSEKTVVVYGHGGELVPQKTAQAFGGISFALQETLNGTAKAVEAAKEAIGDYSGDILILCGDTPLVDAALLNQFLLSHQSAQAHLSVLSATLNDGGNYGRIVRDWNGKFRSIVEARDASPEEKQIREINSGIYLVKRDVLFQTLSEVRCTNAQQEYYLTDIVAHALFHGYTCQAIDGKSFEKTLGINSRAELAHATHILYRRKAQELMENGVTFIDPTSTYIETTVQVGRDSVLYPNVYLEKGTTLGERATVRQGCTLINCRIGNDVMLKDGCFMEGAVLGDHVAVGPYAHLRPDSVLEDHVKIGNFVEIKKSHIGEGSKASHLSYIGDATLGRDVNIGCGTITCNYDGFGKHRTVLEDGVFVGSDTQLVAPVTVGKGTIVAAGTTVTRDVPEESLVISRVEQKVLKGWAARFREKKLREKDGR